MDGHVLVQLLCPAFCLLLFMWYANDITDGVQSTLEKFTDDSKLYRVIHNPCDTEMLQQDLNYISN